LNRFVIFTLECISATNFKEEKNENILSWFFLVFRSMANTDSPVKAVLPTTSARTESTGILLGRLNGTVPRDTAISNYHLVTVLIWALLLTACTSEHSPEQAATVAKDPYHLLSREVFTPSNGKAYRRIFP